MKRFFYPLLLSLCLGFFFLRRAPQCPTLYIYTWSDYLPDPLLQQFTEESGIAVVVSTYDSTESLYAKLKMHPESGYDLIVPSAYFLEKMGREGMLLPLQREALTHWSHLDPLFLSPGYDVGNRYSVPYCWGATGIGIAAGREDLAWVKRWADLWDPQFRGQLLLLDDAREMLQIAGRVAAPQSSERERLTAASQALLALRPNALLFASEALQLPYICGEVDLGIVWNGAAYLAKRHGHPMTFVWPEEGAMLWLDSLAIPRQAPHPEYAHAFINFLLRPEIAAQLTELTGFPSCNQSARAHLPAAIASDPMLYPPPHIVQQGQWLQSLTTLQSEYEVEFQKIKLKEG